MTPRRYRCPRITDLPTMTGRGDDPSWSHAEWTEPFVDILGDGAPAPRYSARTKMMWDHSYFYVHAWLEEPCVWATLTEHDSVIFQDNDFEVFIDPDGDALRYFEFEVNAFGTTWDLFLEKPYRDSGSADNSWETNAEVAVHVDGEINNLAFEHKGWGVEIAFPWSCFSEKGGMPCPPRSGDVWRVNFSRVQWQIEVVDGKVVKVPNTPEDNWVWSPQGVVDMHQPEQWGYVEFMD